MNRSDASRVKRSEVNSGRQELKSYESKRIRKTASA